MNLSENEESFGPSVQIPPPQSRPRPAGCSRRCGPWHRDSLGVGVKPWWGLWDREHLIRSVGLLLGKAVLKGLCRETTGRPAPVCVGPPGSAVSALPVYGGTDARQTLSTMAQKPPQSLEGRNLSPRRGKKKRLFPLFCTSERRLGFLRVMKESPLGTSPVHAAGPLCGPARAPASPPESVGTGGSDLREAAIIPLKCCRHRSSLNLCLIWVGRGIRRPNSEDLHAHTLSLPHSQVKEKSHLSSGR